MTIKEDYIKKEPHSIKIMHKDTDVLSATNKNAYIYWLCRIKYFNGFKGQKGNGYSECILKF